MTRINVVPPHTLARQHLQGEYKEITRVFTLAHNAYARRARISAITRRELTMRDFPFSASGQSPDEILDEVIEDLADMMEGDWWFEDEDAVEVVNE